MSMDATSVAKTVLGTVLAAVNATAPDGPASTTSMAIGRTLQNLAEHSDVPSAGHLLHLPALMTGLVWVVRYVRVSIARKRKQWAHAQRWGGAARGRSPCPPCG